MECREAGESYNLFYWRDRNREVDFVTTSRRLLTAIEVKSGRSKKTQPGLEAFSATFRPGRTLLVGADGIAIDEY